MANKRKPVQNNKRVEPPVREPGPLELPADCRIAALTDLKDTLSSVFGSGVITLDGRQVERVDTAALQLLVLFRRELAALGGSLSWVGASDVLREAVRLLGLTQTLELPAQALA